MMERTIGLRPVQGLPRADGVPAVPAVPPRPARAQLRPVLRRSHDDARHDDDDLDDRPTTHAAHGTDEPRDTPTTPTTAVRRARRGTGGCGHRSHSSPRPAPSPGGPTHRSSRATAATSPAPRRSSSRSWSPPLRPISSALLADPPRGAVDAGRDRARRGDPARAARGARCCSRPTPGRTGRTAGSAPSGDGNPYADPPEAFPENPALPYMGSAWRDTTSVYGPAFTMASEPLAVVAGDSDAVAAWTYKTLAAAAALAAALLAGRLATPAGVRGRARRLEPPPRSPSRGGWPQRRVGRAR